MGEYIKRLIEGKFPCQEVGAETRRERGASSALPALYFLHVWWARRPLTPSRAAVLGSILDESEDPNEFLKVLGIKKYQVKINELWVDISESLINSEGDVFWSLPIIKFINSENKLRKQLRDIYDDLTRNNPELKNKNDIKILHDISIEINCNNIPLGRKLEIRLIAASPAWFNRIMAICSEYGIRIPNLYGYDRAYNFQPERRYDNITVLDPTAGGGSIPFEAMRLGCNVIANDLNPVATAIEKGTIEIPNKYGKGLVVELEKYGGEMVKFVSEKMKQYFPSQHDETVMSYLYCRTVICPHCGKRVPLLNSFALSKKQDGWMVIPKIENVNGKEVLRLVPTRMNKGKGPNGENPEMGTVKKGIGTCVFCGQAIEGEEIKRQACGESEYGEWKDVIYAVVAIKEIPKLDKNGNAMIYASGRKKGEVKTEKITVFREPIQADYDAIKKAECALSMEWSHFENIDLIPTEKIPKGNDMRPVLYGMSRWCDMFTPRQLLSHLVTMEKLHDMIPSIIDTHGREKGSAIIHYLQYMVDKGIDYNSRQTRWITQRGSISGTFSRHDFSLKWTFGEMTYTGVNSGLNWGKNQVIDAYKGICSLLGNKCNGNITILNGSAANMDIKKDSVDIICVDPPYYNNVQYAELSDYFYVWQKRTFSYIYPNLFSRRLTNKLDEAVANPVRDGGTKEASKNYEKLMSEIFAECRRVLKDDGIMTMMFTHKTQEAWETLTRALIENGWIISSSFPVDSEFAAALNQKDLAAAASSIFLACRKRSLEEREPSVWNGFGGTGVQQQLRQSVKESLESYKVLNLNAVDEMVASYGSALRVLSENWPVIDGDNLVSPMDAMREASTIVAQYQMTKLTNGQLNVEDVAPEAGIALTLFGIYGNSSIPYDDALSLSKSLGIRLENKAAGYRDEGRMIGINTERTTRQKEEQEDNGYYAPLVKKGSKLRLVLPEERNALRLEKPQNEWDVLHGLIMAYREGDIPVARAYLQKNASESEEKIIGILKVWADGCGNEKLEKEAQRILYSLK